MGHPQPRRQIHTVEKFRLLKVLTNSSKTVQDRRIVSMNGKLDVLCTLSSGDIADNIG